MAKKANAGEVTQKIVIVEAGFVFCGEVEEHPKHPSLMRITECYNIRTWGTSQGLGELALKGALSGTELDFYGIVTIPKIKILGYIECEVKIEKK